MYREEYLNMRCHDELDVDVVLFPTISRFDTVYAPYFRCGGRRISDFPNLYRWCREFWNLPSTFANVCSHTECSTLDKILIF